MNKMSTARSNVAEFPVVLGNEIDDPAMRPVKELSFWQQRAVDLKLKTMANAPHKPYWNTTMVTAWCVVAGFLLGLSIAIASLYSYTAETNRKAGYEAGVADQKNIELQRKLEEQDAELKRQGEILKMVVNPQEKQ